MTSRTPPPAPSVLLWLAAVYLMILAMVLVGGITRLTGSGLSMVEWKPLIGAIPPLNDADWSSTFDLYKATPQYQLVNDWMTIGDFKRIFFWEYLHRLLGRLIGVVYFFPWVFFVATRRIQGALVGKTAAAFVLGGLQGALGWFMVKSGLVDVPEVSHLRLAAHLLLAFVVGMWVLYLMLELGFASNPTEDDDDTADTSPIETPLHQARARTFPRWAPSATIALVVVQIVYGAFMAGKRAGLLFQTYPTMNGSMFPRESFIGDSLISIVVDNPVFIHAFHRTFALVVLVAVGGLSAALIKHGRRRHRSLGKALAAIVVAQMILGIGVVVLAVPISWAALHQGGAFILLSVLVAVVHAERQERRR